MLQFWVGCTPKYSSKYELISANVLILKKDFALNDQLLDTYK